MQDEQNKLTDSDDNPLQEPLNEPPVPTGDGGFLNVTPIPVDEKHRLKFKDLNPEQQEIVRFNDLQLRKSDLTKRQEKMVAWSPTGKTLTAIGTFGEAQQVYETHISRTDSETMRQARDYTACHNHPLGTSFSFEDWQTAYNCNLKELQVIGQYKNFTYLYVIERPSTGWPVIDRQAWDKQHAFAAGITSIKESLEKLPKSKAAMDIRHQTNDGFSGRNVVKYTVYLILR